MSFSHLILLGIIAIIVIPPDKLPEVARQVAKFLTDMRRMTSSLFDDIKNDINVKPEEIFKPQSMSSAIEAESENRIEPENSVTTETSEKKPHE